MVRILFICIGNMFRSQLAESFAKHYGGGFVEAMSAGTWLETFSEAERRERLLKAAEVLRISFEGKSERQLVEEFKKKVMEMNKEVFEVLRKRINFSLRAPKKLEPWMLNWADIIVALCPEAAATCPRNLVKDKKVVVWKIEDPFNKHPSKVKEIVDEIEKSVKQLINDLAKLQEET